jgi:hypothetical protein
VVQGRAGHVRLVQAHLGQQAEQVGQLRQGGPLQGREGRRDEAVEHVGR